MFFRSLSWFYDAVNCGNLSLISEPNQQIPEGSYTSNPLLHPVRFPELRREGQSSGAFAAALRDEDAGEGR